MAASTLFLSWIASGIYNLDSRRFRKASLDRRSEGWTETWENINGTSDEETKTSEENDKLENLRKMEIDDESISQVLSTPYPQAEIVLTQHQPAWFEQMLMRVAGLPHIVLNSNHITNEATGKLPYLRDYIPSKSPVLVGRNHPSDIKKSENMINNSILTYLQEYRNIDLDEQAGLITDQQRGSSKIFQFMINRELSTILSNLRFEDSDAWEQVYREQYVEASNIESNKKDRLWSVNTINWFIKLRGRFQALMERNFERKYLMEYVPIGRTKSINQLLQRANEAYFAIDRQLLCTMNEDKSDCDKYYLFGTEKPALVDVLLWAHMAEALCDVNLVVILASYPRLMNYFQHMYQSYFSTAAGESAENCAWKHWNDQQNLDNSFHKIPTLNKRNISQYSMIKNANDLMQKSSLEKQNLAEALEAVKLMRAEERLPNQREPQSFLLYRLCMGEKVEKERAEVQNNPLRKKLLRDQARNDQMWISGILGISTIAIILIRGRS